MSASILAFITAVDLGTKKTNTLVLVSLIAIGVVAGVSFVLTEKYWATEPIFPLELLGKDAVITSYAIMFIQTGIQVAVSMRKYSFCCHVLTCIISSCFWYRYTSRSQSMQAWAKLGPTLSLQYSETHSVVLPSVHGSSGESHLPNHLLSSSHLTHLQYRSLQTSNHPRQSISNTLFLPPLDLLARSHQHSRLSRHILWWLWIRNGQFCCFCWVDRRS
jgi:hypothetical protein